MQGFNEADYLTANPDIASKVAAGDFASGMDQYIKWGKDAGRSWELPETVFDPITSQDFSGTNETPLSYSYSDDYSTPQSVNATVFDSASIGAAIAEAVAGAISQGSSGEITINLVLDGQVIDSRVIDLLTHDPEARTQMEVANG